MMTSVLFAKFPTILRSTFIVSQIPQITCQRLINVSSVDFAARKGTREKAKKKKVKVEVKKVGFIPHNLRGKRHIIKKVEKPIEDGHKFLPSDNVWMDKLYRWKIYSIAEAIQFFKETHHPTLYNLPDAFVNIQIELNMQGLKKTKFVDSFSRICITPHAFSRDETRTILVFCKEKEAHNAILDAGASVVGGLEMVKQIQSGDLSTVEFDYILAHPNIMLDIVPIRGLLKKKFPNPKLGSVNADLIKAVKHHLNGIQYSAERHTYDKTFGRVDVAFGRLNMETPQLEENLISLIKDLDSMRPKREGTFITRCFMHSRPCSILYKIDPFVHIESGFVSTAKKPKVTALITEEDSDSDDEEKEKEKIAHNA